MNRIMSFSNPPPRRKRLSRLPAFAQYQEANYQEAQYQEAGSEMERSLRETNPSLRVSGPFYAIPDGEPIPGDRVEDDFPDSAFSRGWAVLDEAFDDAEGGDDTENHRTVRGILLGAIAGFVAAAAALGAANLAAVFVQRQASPSVAVGGAFVGRAPSWLRDFAVQEFGADNAMMLLVIMYAVAAVLAVAIGILSWRHVSVGVAALAFFGAIGAIAAWTQSESKAIDIVPSVAGGLVGIAAIIVLIRAGRALDRAS